MNVTIHDLVRILQEGGERDEQANTNLDADSDIADMEFDDLGFDSLAVLNAVDRIMQEYGVAPRYDDVAEARTPTKLVALVNEALHAVRDRE